MARCHCDAAGSRARIIVRHMVPTFVGDSIATSTLAISAMIHLAQTGHILRLKNRPGNVHDSKQAAHFLRELIDSLRARLGRALPLEFRMDAAFFQRDVLRLLIRHRCAYAIKVGYWSWLPLKQLAAEARTWQC